MGINIVCKVFNMKTMAMVIIIIAIISSNFSLDSGSAIKKIY